MFGFLDHSFGYIFVSKNKISVFFLGDFADFSFHEIHAHSFGLLIKFFESLAKRSNIDVINRNICHRQSTHQQLSLFHRVHTANLRTNGVADSIISRTGAEHISDAVGHFAVAWSQNGIVRSCRSNFSFHLHGRDYIFVLTVTEAWYLEWIEKVKTGGEYDRFGVKLIVFRFHRKVDAMRRTGFFASAAQGAIFDIDDRCFGIGNAEWNKSRLATDEPELIFVPNAHRAGFFAQLTGRAVFHSYITWFFRDLCNEIVVAFFCDMSYLAFGENGDIFVSSYFRYFWSRDASGAIESRKYFTQQNHFPAERVIFFHQQHLVAGVGKIDGGFASGNSCADYQSIVLDNFSFFH